MNVCLFTENNHIFRVLCTDLGEQELTITVSNGITSKNKIPASATTSIRYSLHAYTSIRPMVLVHDFFNKNKTTC